MKKIKKPVNNFIFIGWLLSVGKYLSIIIIFVFLAGLTLQAASPFKSSWETDGLAGGTALGIDILSITLYPFGDTLNRQELRDLKPGNVNCFDRSACYNYSETTDDLSDYLLAVCAALPLTILASDDVSKDFSTFSLMYLENLSFSTSLPMLTKSFIRRPRPYTYNPQVPEDKKMSADAGLSFFSGHTSIAFASAVFFGRLFSSYFPDSKWEPYAWGGSLLLSSLTGYMRYDSGRHFPTDIIVGALVGSAVGYLIPELHKNNKKVSGKTPGPDNYMNHRSVVVTFGFGF